ncbi:probable 5-hydroxyisourate hydrolase ZK697.8 isoform X2 [Schistocerca nitens]|uniref:probable 5-hydroxyisourate hydrolase ZK697.8 isoform X2 n=1 Tax=Schistocerca nitens TaxID=7011 RepID=UPI002118B658|nr:probable 5-hydroxyisourate hydrolase ZK697.8 isoform X2 [Schistocerca nitens]
MFSILKIIKSSFQNCIIRIRVNCWLKSVPGEPNRAFCLYCNRSLHAHCLSLLKHLCTLKHTRAAQAIAPEQFPCDIGGEKNTEAQQNLIGSEETGIEAACQQIITNNGVSVEQNMLSTEGSIVAAQKQVAGSEMSTAQGRKKGISTHVLDTAKGKPANGLQVSLYRLMGGKWTIVSEGYTDEDGRFSNFLQDLELCSGRYKLHFDVDRYFDSTSQESLYPFVEIAFDVKSQQDHYHIPLLLSPFGYTTYRGS